jgi:uncharacterized protein YndB with AHSA1/START domain
VNDHIAIDTYGVLTEPTTLKIQRILSAPIERVWAYLTESELRRQWLAAGEMQLQVDTPFEFVWRNDELTDPPGLRPSDFSDEHRMQCWITKINPPHEIAFTWGDDGEVSIELVPQGEKVLLTLIHYRLSDRSTKLMVGAGWHMHLDILVARFTGTKPEPFWDGWKRLQKEYDARIHA